MSALAEIHRSWKADEGFGGLLTERLIQVFGGPYAAQYGAGGAYMLEFAANDGIASCSASAVDGGLYSYAVFCALTDLQAQQRVSAALRDLPL